MSLIIKKVLNSSVVLAEDINHSESIILGKGIGYGAKQGQVIPQSDVYQFFVPIQSEQQSQIMALLDQISPEVVNVTTEIVQHANEKLKQTLTTRLSFTLMDHIDFVLQRLKNGMNIQNKLYWEVQTYYPEEFMVGQKAISLINERFNVELPKEEVANIAFHIINAEQDNDEDYDSLKITELVDDVVNLVRYQAKKDLPSGSISYQRLITHVKFFANRLFTDRQLDGSDDVMTMHLQNKYPIATRVANQICAFIQRKYGLQVSNEEFTFLVIHVERNIK
ncbi:PRD domain-containing protein [Liquorilactobacillus mali]|uniref:Beta-glucoside bgl operon transcription antiterminator n=1 Tax=Liquorilactobacillus mali KCTC 3596 = DSM 20444 TaxID=1046596 RepID=J0KZ39_9LACO|nr:PRD domain-containing protein [Liquorilactobacillus mali]EJE99710.1 beta-glucoside bgl operon transcription antiterminator [Liquorilactobacillus mali KCTC 3596 = DSM 20444]KRN08984.1 beta-glucoside bgl operon transcription antiterminator [Liquorilactobacillus mali KCTC 3596 = DSM 20444]MDC7953484.1 PRD domain-containing protein [Liquorilactobacillus mali]QFQ73869.1 PRD domain-containing protein [Liquorilactobacillus mali]